MANANLIDPLERRIILHDHTWFGHIIKGHPDMKSQRKEVENAVRKPMAIHFSTSDENCRVYCGSGRGNQLMVAVVADVVEGFVKTAYQSQSTRGEAMK